MKAYTVPCSECGKPTDSAWSRSAGVLCGACEKQMRADMKKASK